MDKLKIGTELIDENGNRAVLLNPEINPSVMTSEGEVIKFTNLTSLLNCYSPTDYMYTEVLALISHMKVMEKVGKGEQNGQNEQSDNT